MTKFVNPSSAGDFACSAGELEIESESWSLQPKAGDLAYMHCYEGLSFCDQTGCSHAVTLPDGTTKSTQSPPEVIQEHTKDPTPLSHVGHLPTLNFSHVGICYPG